MSRLTPADIRVLHEALDEEHHAWATCDQVIADFGEVGPFPEIRDAVSRHVAELSALFLRHRLRLPDNPWPGRVDRYATLAQACRAGVEAEIANDEMYERLIAETGSPEIRDALRELRSASRERLLPAFRRCFEAGPCGSAAEDEGGRQAGLVKRS